MYTPDLLARAAAESRSLVDLMRRLNVPLGSGARRYLRGRLDHYGIDTTHFIEEPLPIRPRAVYTKDRLEEAAVRSHSVRDMLTFLGIPYYDSAYSHLRRKLDQFGIDTTHFTGRRGRGPQRILPRDSLEHAVSHSYSLAEVLRRLGIPVGGAGRALVRRSIASHAISTNHFVGQGHQRGRPSPRRKPPTAILRKLRPGAARTKTPLLRRALDESGVPRVCVACGTGDRWRGRRLVLEIDHVNGDRLDNRIGNLRYLCPSCHSQTRTFATRRAGTTTWRQGIGTQ
ncbi:HNH endonuclease [Streptomyces cucumeris]|uniref:HNH endonuclease signature motif containing protein n=1 Tax=Streptomyces cucumeris TaxID=2962890 RepID=UPI0027E4E640|nr:HNH endonuclease [Streptomyces sp. NEAU-Y11]